MTGSRQIVKAPDGLHYGSQRPLDPVDGFANDFLRSKKRALSYDFENAVAVDLGCHTGQRALHLAAAKVVRRIIAIDITHHEKFFGEWNRSNPVTPIEFRQKNCRNVTPRDFEGMDVVFFNMRRVLHFLAPQDVRRFLITIRDTLAPGGLAVISFDVTGKNVDFDRRMSIHDNRSHFYADAKRKRAGKAPYGIYRGGEVEEFMQDLGFDIYRKQMAGEIREYEHIIVAKLPEPRAAVFVEGHSATTSRHSIYS